MKDVDPDPLDWRHERKFAVTDVGHPEVSWAVRLHPARFARAYPDRYVNNLYLDSPDRRCFADALAGLPERVKYRIRWYGDLTGSVAQPVFEVKHRRGTAGSKQAFPLAAFAVSRGQRLAVARERIAAAALPPALRERVAELRLQLLNRYRREYWISADGLLRLTLDTELEFVAVGAGRNSLARRWLEHEHTVLELKYAVEHDERGRWAASRLPFRLTRSSKYVRGVERVG